MRTVLPPAAQQRRNVTNSNKQDTGQIMMLWYYDGAAISVSVINIKISVDYNGRSVLADRWGQDAAPLGCTTVNAPAAPLLISYKWILLELLHSSGCYLDIPDCAPALVPRHRAAHPHPHLRLGGDQHGQQGQQGGGHHGGHVDGHSPTMSSPRTVLHCVTLCRTVLLLHCCTDVCTPRWPAGDCGPAGVSPHCCRPGARHLSHPPARFVAQRAEQETNFSGELANWFALISFSRVFLFYQTYWCPIFWLPALLASSASDRKNSALVKTAELLCPTVQRAVSSDSFSPLL